jgi:acyl-CoA reductase-like NAD-dependent aldehyde dehydrogenase
MCVVGILTRDIGKALEFSQKVQAGSVWINCYDHTVCQVSLLEFGCFRKWFFYV